MFLATSECLVGIHKILDTLTQTTVCTMECYCWNGEWEARAAGTWRTRDCPGLRVQTLEIDRPEFLSITSPKPQLCDLGTVT